MSITFENGASDMLRLVDEVLVNRLKIKPNYYVDWDVKYDSSTDMFTISAIPKPTSMALKAETIVIDRRAFIPNTIPGSLDALFDIYYKATKLSVNYKVKQQLELLFKFALPNWDYDALVVGEMIWISGISRKTQITSKFGVGVKTIIEDFDSVHGKFKVLENEILFPNFKREPILL